MNHKRFLFIVALMAVFITVSGQDYPEHKVLFEKAKFTMETKGDLNGAIDLFNNIIKKYPKEREYAAKSQLYIGLCYEKLGVKEAQKAYRKVVDNYPEQIEAVKLANEKLSLLLRAETLTGKEDKEFSIRRVKEGLDVGVLGAVSPDGRYLSYADDGPLDLAIYEIATGNKRVLIKGDIASDAYYSMWSPDGELVAYIWYQDGLYGLSVVGLDGTEPRDLIRDTEVGWLDLEDWSPDGKSILTVLYREDKTSQMVMVSVRDGSVRVLKNFGERAPGPSRFSPDGRYIAYTLQQSPESGEKDIFILALDEGREYPLVQDPANDVVLDWTPDGNEILFRSDRSGNMGAWWIQISEGKSRGTPELLKPDLGTDFIPMGFTQNGAYYYGTKKEMKDVYIAELDLVTGKVISAPSLATQRFAGSNYCPNWSPDGKQLLYLSQRESGAWGARTICLYSPDNGEVQELFSKLDQIAFACWCPDGSSLLAGAANPDGGYGIFQINVETGNFELLLPILVGWGATMSYDGKVIYYYQYDPIPNKLAIVMRELEAGLEKELNNLILDSSYYTTSFVLSPDGQKIAFAVTESGSTAIKVMPSTGGEARELLRGDTKLILSRRYSIAWSPDGESVLFVKPEIPGGSKTELWLIPLQGGEPRKLELTAQNMHDLSVHPDGRHIAFTAGQTRSEIWVMKNFLPEEKSETNNQLTLRKLDYTQLNTPFARLSPDGKKIAYVVYVGGSPKRIDMLDLDSGIEKVLVESGAIGQLSPVWSPQSDKIAYTLRGEELHICDIDGANSQVLLKNPEYMIYPFDWSRDGERILCFFERDDWTIRIGTVTSDGQVQFLASGSNVEFSSEPKISPDGGYVTCSLKDEAGNTDIFVWTSDGSRKVQVTKHPGRDENPVWSPDGKYLVFLSDRNRSVDLWGVQIKNGVTVGAPFIIKQDLGWRTMIQGLTENGKLFLLMLGGAEPDNLFTVPVDQANGSLNGTIAPISVNPTDHSFPRYSPDGKMIAYLSRRGQISMPKLFVLDEKGIERELPLQDHYATNIAWHPESRSLFFAGWDKAFKSGIYEVLLDKSEIRSIYNGETVDPKTYKGGLININLLPGAGKMMFFRLLGKGYVDVLTWKPGGQQPAVILPRVKMPVWGLPSPTGENICYRIGDSLMVVSVSNGATKFIGSSTLNIEATWAPHGESLMFREGSGLKIFSLKENTSHTLYQAPAGKTIGGMEMYATAWSPNGSYVIFAERDTSESSTSPQKLFLINPVDGSLRKLGEAPEGYRLSELRWSPDGSKIVATGNNISSTRVPIYEYWVLENFLPK